MSIEKEEPQPNNTNPTQEPSDFSLGEFLDAYKALRKPQAQETKKEQPFDLMEALRAATEAGKKRAQERDSEE